MAARSGRWEFQCERCRFHGCAFDGKVAAELAAAHERASGHSVCSEHRRSVATG